MMNNLGEDAVAKTDSSTAREPVQGFEILKFDGRN